MTTYFLKNEKTAPKALFEMKMFLFRKPGRGNDRIFFLLYPQNFLFVP